MQIITSLSPCAPLPELPIDAALVIDVLRATSVMATAVAAGASQITTVAQIDEARSLAQQSCPTALLCGERGCQPIDGFDLGNSPAEYSPSVVAGRALILTTTNGTQAIQRTTTAREMFAASFLNLSATIQAVQHFNRIHLVCAGTDGYLSGEDVLLAGAIVEALQRCVFEVKSCDGSRLALATWQQHFPSRPPSGQLASALKSTQGGRNLMRLGLGDDLLRCAHIDQAPVIVRRTTRHPATFSGTRN